MLNEIQYKQEKIALSLAFLGMVFCLVCCVGFSERLESTLQEAWVSICTYFSTMFRLPYTPPDISPIVPPVNVIPPEAETFPVFMEAFGKALINGENAGRYFMSISAVWVVGLSVLVMFAGISAVLWTQIKIKAKQGDGKGGQETRALKLFHTLTAPLVVKGRKWQREIKEFRRFLENNRWITAIYVCLFLLGANIISIGIGLFAFLLRFPFTFDFPYFYTSLRWLFSDIATMFEAAPWWIWTALFGVLFVRWRKQIGYRRLRRREAKNQKTIENELGIMTYICGTVGRGKTTMLVDMTLSTSVLFRKKAFKLLQKNALRFPHFPWGKLENELREAIEKHCVFSLYTCRKWIEAKKKAYSLSPQAKACWGYTGRMEYDDKLSVRTIWEVAEAYACLYFISLVQSSLIVANLGIREDVFREIKENLPIYDFDFFDTKKRDDQMAHILDFDILRLGKTVLNANVNAGSFEFGIVAMTEGGKERGNAIELRGVKKDADSANQRNDLMALWFKLCRHPSTVDFFPFVRVFIDDQRPESFGADSRELCDRVLHLEKPDRKKLLMPFFGLEELLCQMVFDLYDKLYIAGASGYKSVSLPMYIFSGIVGKLWRYYERIHDTFDSELVRIRAESGKLGEKMDKMKYYISTQKARKNRFSTDCFREYFGEELSDAKVGIYDYACYEDARASFKELEKGNSYFIFDLIAAGKMRKQQREKRK